MEYRDVYNIYPESFKWRHISPANELRTPEENPSAFRPDYKTPYRFSPYFLRKLRPIEDSIKFQLHPKYADFYKKLDNNDENHELKQYITKENFTTIDFENNPSNIRDFVRSIHARESVNLTHYELNPFVNKANAVDNHLKVVDNSGYERTVDILDGNPMWHVIYFESIQTLYNFDNDVKENNNYRIDVYVGKTKKWQAINDMFGKDEVNKIQVAIGAPVQEQLDLWDEENSHKYIQCPISNENQAKFRDHPQHYENLDHDYDNILYERERNRTWETMRNMRYWHLEKSLDKDYHH